MAIVISDYLAEQLATVASQDASGIAGPLNDCIVGLFSNEISLNSSTVVGQLTIVMSYGVSPVAVTWTDLGKSSNGDWVLNSDLSSFKLTDSADAFTAQGYFVASADATHLLFSEQFTAPINFPDSDYEMSMSAQFRQSHSNSGTATVIG